MKAIKVILLLATISVFTSIPTNAEAKRDCSEAKGFHAKLMCNLFGKNDVEVSNKTEIAESSQKEEKSGGGLFGKGRCKSFVECFPKVDDFWESLKK